MGERIEGVVGWEGLRGWGWGFIDMGLVWILENFRAYDLYLKSFLFSFPFFCFLIILILYL